MLHSIGSIEKEMFSDTSDMCMNVLPRFFASRDAVGMEGIHLNLTIEELCS